jgi:hypothetical protein
VIVLTVIISWVTVRNPSRRDGAQPGRLLEDRAQVIAQKIAETGHIPGISIAVDRL